MSEHNSLYIQAKRNMIRTGDESGEGTHDIR